MAEPNETGAPGSLPNNRPFWAGSVQSMEQTNALLGQALAAASPDAVFGQPVQVGDTVVIPCNELSVSIGVGYGGGYGGGGDTQSAGGGGGGGSMGRPVGVVTVRPDGVRWEPAVDTTKLGIAFFTTIAAMFMMWGSMRRTLGK